MDELELERVLVNPLRRQAETPIFWNWKATLPVVPRLPPWFLKPTRTLATVRTTLSVAVSTTTAIPCGP